MTWYTEVSGTHKCIYGAIATARAVCINVYTAFKVLTVVHKKLRVSEGQLK